MKIHILRKLIIAVIVLIIIGTIFEWINDSPELVISLFAGAVYLVCYKIARKNIDPTASYFFWMALPSVLFFIVPFLWSIYFNTEEQSNVENILNYLPFISIVLIPIILLVIVHQALKVYEE